MIRCIAIDDEPLALDQVSRYIRRIPSLQLVGAYYSVGEALSALDNEHIDVLFLDIEMPDISGIDFARQLGDRCPYIIFTTAYPQFAVEGFRLDAVDYLLKPLSFEEMVAAIDKVKRRMTAVTADAESFIFVKSSGTVHKLAVKDILYIKGLGEYVQIYLKRQHTPIVTFDSIKRLEGELSPHSFMRVHKSFLVNLNAITAATRQSLTIDGEVIPVGDKYRADFAQYIKDKLTNP